MKLLAGNLYGATLARRATAAGLILTETTYDADLRLPAHSHEHAYFCFVLQGRYDEIYGARSYEKRRRECRTSTLVFHPAGEIHADRFHTSARCFNLHTTACWLERLPSSYRSFAREPFDVRGGQPAHLAARLYDEIRCFDQFSALAVEGIALELVAVASRDAERVKQSPKPPRWLVQAREMLDERNVEKLSLGEIATTVGVHPVHLAREFRRFYHCTTGEYVRACRIESARRQISASDQPLSSIALAAGFFDQSHFTRIFKRFTGMTPHQYRRSFRAR